MKGPTPVIESADGRFSMALTGNFAYDLGFYDQDAIATGQQDVRVEPDLNTGTNLRFGRFGVVGRVDRDWKFLFRLDAGGSPAGTVRLDEAWISYTGLEPLTMTVGQHRAPNSFEELTSNTNLNFIERSFASNMAVLNGSFKRVGASVKASGDWWHLAGGAFTDAYSTEADDEQLSLNGRIAVAPINTDDATLHFGASGWFIFETTQDGDERLIFADRPEFRVDSARWIFAQSNPVMANDDGFMYGFEMAAKFRSAWAQAEVFRFGMSQSLDPAGQPTLTPDLDYLAYYVSLGYILTGETKPYSMSSASWTAVKPAEPFNLEAGGWGAWEIALRYSYADLDDKENTISNGVLVGTRGGIEQNWTVGLNWYINNHIRMLFNYINVGVDRQNAAGLQQGDDFDIFAVRMAVKW